MAARLVAGDPDRRIGTAIMLKVMPGDRFTISADAYHEGDLPNDGSTGMEDMLESLLNTLLGGSTYAGATVADLPSNVATVTTALTTPGLADQIADLQLVNHDPAAPKAHLNVLFFDESLKLVPEYSAVGQVPASLTSWINVIPTPNQGVNTCCATPGAGYVVIYVDNQTIGKDVWFDNISIEHYTSNVIEENHYYPFGLTLTTTAAGAKEQPYKYNTKELEKSFGVEMYDFGARMHDPQLGRWFGVDPLANLMRRHSPYNYAFNNPVRFIDPDGMSAKEYFNESGKRLGQDENGIDGNVQIVTDKAEKKLIEKNDKMGNYTESSLVTSGVNTTKAVLAEADHVLQRTIDNGGRSEEVSIVKADGTVARGVPGPEKELNDGTIVSTSVAPPVADDMNNTSIHSHETYIENLGGGNYGNASSALKPGPDDPGNFTKFNLNIIVGNLGMPFQRTNGSTGAKTDVMPKQGAAFYNSTDLKPVLQISRQALKDIIN